MRSRASGASAESTTSSGQATGWIAALAIRLPASAGEIVASGTMSMPPVALAMAARLGQLTAGPTPTDETLIRLFLSAVSRWRNSAVSTPAIPGPSPI